MSGLYNVLFGFGPDIPRILAALDLQPQDFGRFRDAYVAGGELVVYTRLGGGNRQDYVPVFRKMEKHPDYLRDVDDTYDGTYCTFYFRIPDRAASLRELDIGPWDPDKRWKDALARLESAKAGDPWLDKVMNAARPALDPLVKAMAGAKHVEIEIISTGRDPKKVLK